MGRLARSGRESARRSLRDPGRLNRHPSVITVSGSSMKQIIGPMMPWSGWCRPPPAGGRQVWGATIVSLLSRSTHSAPCSSAWRIPVLFPPAQPPFASRRMTVAHGWAWVNWLEGSGVEPFSTTIVRQFSRSMAFKESRHLSVSIVPWKLSTTIPTLEDCAASEGELAMRSYSPGGHASSRRTYRPGQVSVLSIPNTSASDDVLVSER